MDIDKDIKKAKARINERIEMLYIQAKSKLISDSLELDKKLDVKLLETYLKKRGYSLNYILNKPVMVKGFTCVCVNDDNIEVWHDKTNNDKPIYINESLLTGLPITLNYMERI
jgi:hypothetical protein